MSKPINLDGEKPDHIPQEQWDLLKEKFDEIYEDDEGEQTMGEVKLKPCPFCGGEAVTHDCIELENEQLRGIYGGKVGVHCSVCKVATIPFDDETQAVEVWNRRTGND